MMSNTIEVRTPILHFDVPSFQTNELKKTRKKTKEQLRDLLKEFSDEPFTKKEHFRVPFSDWKIVLQEMVNFITKNIDELEFLGINKSNLEEVQNLPAHCHFSLVSYIVWKNEFQDFLEFEDV